MDILLFLALGAALGSAVVDAGGGNDATAHRLRAGGDGDDDDDDEKKQPALPDLRPTHTTTTSSQRQPLERQRAEVSEKEFLEGIMTELNQETKQEW